jgi:hypothetical protein
VVVVVVVGMTRDFCLVSKHRAAGYGTVRFSRTFSGWGLAGALKLFTIPPHQPLPFNSTTTTSSSPSPSSSFYF